MACPGLDAAQPVRKELLLWLEATLQAERRAVAVELEQRHADLVQELSTKLTASLSPRAADVDLHTAGDVKLRVKEAMADPAAAATAGLPGSLQELTPAPRPKAREDCAPLDGPAAPGKLGVPAADEASAKEASEGETQCQKKKKKSAVLDYAQGQVQNFITDDAPAALMHVSDSRTSPVLLRVQQLAASATFEVVFIMLIVLNSILLAIEVQYRGKLEGPPLGYPGSRRSSDADTAFEVFEWIFGVMFLIEIIIRLAALRGSFFILPHWEQAQQAPESGSLAKRKLRKACRLLMHVDWWNVLDLVIVLAWLLTATGATSLPLDPMMLRVARLGRLMRLLRLVRTIQGFDALYLLTATLKSAMMALFWSAVLLLVIQLVTALAMNQLLEKFYTDAANPVEKRQQVYMYFGTFTRALFTAFELTLGNYGPISRALIESVSEWWAIFFILHKCSVGFAVVSVVRGVFLYETMKVATQDDFVLLSHKNTAKKTHRRKMERLFSLVDADGSDMIELEEFRNVCQNPVLATWLQSLELDVQDADMVFKAIAGPNSTRMTKTNLISGMSKLKGPARSMEIAIFKEEVRDKIRGLRSDLGHTKLVP